MTKRLPVVFGILAFALFLVSPLFVTKASAAPSNTTCDDKKTSRISGKVWDKIVWGNNDASTGVKDVTVEIKRAGDGKTIRVQTGKGYKTDSNGNFIEVRELTTPGEAPGPRYGIWDVCGFIYDAEWFEVDYRGNVIPEKDYRPKGGVPHPYTVFTVKVVGVPSGYTNKSFTTFNPTYVLTRGSTIPGTQDSSTKADTKYGAIEYKNQVASSTADPRNIAGITTCSQNYDNDNDSDTRDGVKHRCDFLIEKVAQQTAVMGRVAEINPSTRQVIQYWSTNPSTSVCAATYPRHPQLTIQSVRLGNPDVTGSSSVNYCNPQPYYTLGAVPSAQRRLSVLNIPPGYVCDSWSYSIYNKTSGKWEKKSEGNGCTTATLNTYELSATYDNSHHVWFYIKKPATTSIPTSVVTKAPTTKPTVVSTKTPTTKPTIVATKAPTIAPTLPPVSCSIVPVDIVLMLDRSSSMWEEDEKVDGKTKLTWAIEAATAFINEFEKLSKQTGWNNRVRLGIGSFAKTGIMHTTTMTSNFTTARNDLAKIASGDTRSCLECGLKAANDKLQQAGNNNGDTRTAKLVVFLSDGRANTISGGTSAGDTVAGNAAIAEAVRGRGNGKFGKVYGKNYIYYVVGYGSDVREWVLKGAPKDSTLGTLGIANGTGSPYYRYNDSAIDWDTEFAKIQQNICGNSLLRASAGDPLQDVAGAMSKSEKQALFDDIVEYLRAKLLN